MPSETWIVCWSQYSSHWRVQIKPMCVSRIAENDYVRVVLDGLLIIRVVRSYYLPIAAYMILSCASMNNISVTSVDF